MEALDDVGDELGIGDGRTDLGEGVSRRLLQVKVLGDGPILLLDVVELLGEINLAALLVVVEERDDGGPDLVCRGGGGVGRHDEVDDVHGHGAIEPAEHEGVEAEPRWVGGGHLGGEVVLEGVGGDDDVEDGPPLGEDGALELEDDGDEGADALDGGGLRPKGGVGVRSSRLSRLGGRHGREVVAGGAGAGAGGARVGGSGSERMCLG